MNEVQFIMTLGSMAITFLGSLSIIALGIWLKNKRGIG